MFEQNRVYDSRNSVASYLLFAIYVQHVLRRL